MIARWVDDIWLHRVAFALVNIAVLALIWLLVIWPVGALFSDRDARIFEQRALLARLNAIAAQRETVDALLVHSASERNRPEFLQGANDGAAAANLQTALNGMAQGAGARVRSVRSLPVKLEGDMKVIGAQLELTGTIEAIYHAAQAIEGAVPFLFIREALLKPSQMLAGPNGSNVVPTLDAQIEVVAIVQTPGIQ